LANVVLVVDDDAQVVGALRRYLSLSFDQVLTAQNSAEAEAALAFASPPVTHLVCDYDLGPGEPTGTMLIPRLRAAHPSIRVAVLVTGSALDLADVVPGVDRKFRKPCDVEELTRVLLSHGAPGPERSG